MERIPDTVDVAMVAERLRPLAQQASEGLRHTSEGLRHTSEGLRHASDSLLQTLDEAREAIVERIGSDAPIVLVERPAAVALAARSLPVAARLRDLRRGPLQWLALAVATAVVATLAALTIAAIARRMQARRASVVKEGALVETVEPVVIAISEEGGDAAAQEQAEAALDDVEERVAEAG
jgi:hypothetical protein